MRSRPKVLLVAYDRQSSGIGSYTLEVANLMKDVADISLLSYDKLDRKTEGIKTIEVALRMKSRAFPILSFILNMNFLCGIFNMFDIIHETLPPWGSCVKDRLVITTKWGYVSHFKLALIRTKGLSFPENVGAIPVTAQHSLMDAISRRKARFIVSVNEEGQDFVPPPIEQRTIKKYECKDELNLLFVSRDLNIKRKNLEAVISALKFVRKRKIKLHLVGKGHVDVDAIKYGYLSREDVIKLMYKMDALILPSTYEELGYIGLESYSVGLPALVSDIPSFRTIFKLSPRFNPYDSREIAKLIEDLSCYDLEEIGRREWEYIKISNKVSKERFIKLYQMFYNE
ncbi:MAG: glycosyltransferase family 4 protein [Nitrososphaerota archaeon]|jgi:glycosyltransferase involved in cell wall biosynthesis|nr:glycosyltransferase family 4 protein [Nitrososphaerota archaeon]MDG6933028.1 glycosyltransferase family 4 protein [Nitrososphaerota archaeon]MDG6935530.1 glycosyltransferase family 4 protein [Nitrososphaerota archaeon]MDG6944246.1 glycosyltransferase family 4 protein [Nitrososphaerota archaeon]